MPAQIIQRKHHLLGMAKSAVGSTFGRNFNPGSSRALELDVVRLVLAKAHLESAGERFSGALVVLDPKIKELCEMWLKKYYVTKGIEIICPELTDDEKLELLKEKEDNSTLESDKADASYGKKLAERHLRAHFERQFPGFIDQPERKFPFDVQWDFRAEANTAQGNPGGQSIKME